MKKFIIAAALLLMCLPFCKAEDPFAFLEEGAADYSIVDKLAAKQPVTFKIKDYVNKTTNPALVGYTQTAFAEWFVNVLNLAAKNKKSAQAIKPLEAEIKFAATSANYHNVPYSSNADLEVRYTNINIIQKECKHSDAAGCFVIGSNIIWALYPEKLTPPFSKDDMARRVIIHEFGHALTFSDLYGRGNTIDRTRGSGIQPSVMNQSTYLTGDDADGAVYVLYEALKRKNPYIEPLNLPSFQKQGRVLADDKLTKQEFYYEDENGLRVFYSNCNGSNIAPKLTVNVKDFNKPLNFEEADRKCLAPILAQGSFKDITNVTAAYTNKNPYLANYVKNIISGKEKIYHKGLVKGSGAIDIFVHSGGEIPLFAYAIAEGKIIYLYAYLNEGYNFVYSYPFRYKKLHGEDSCGLAGCKEKHGPSEVFLYSRTYPYPAYVMGNPSDNKEVCKSYPDNCTEMKELGKKYRAFFEQNLGTVRPLGGWLEQYSQRNIRDNLSWHYSLIKTFPPAKKEPFSLSVFKKNEKNTGNTKQGAKISNQINSIKPF